MSTILYNSIVFSVAFLLMANSLKDGTVRLHPEMGVAVLAITVAIVCACFPRDMEVAKPFHGKGLKT